jgi:hypothetical protein
VGEDDSPVARTVCTPEPVGRIAGTMVGVTRIVTAASPSDRACPGGPPGGAGRAADLPVHSFGVTAAATGSSSLLS